MKCSWLIQCIGFHDTVYQINYKFIWNSNALVRVCVCFGLTDAVRVCHALAGHAVAPQALMHVVAGVAVLHPIVGCRGDDQEDVAYSGAEQAASHEAVHTDPPQHTHTDTHTKHT